MVVLPCALVAAARRRRPLHGDARFATHAEVSRSGLLATDGRPSIIVGRFRGRLLALPGQLSVMLSAPTRSGKGVGVVIPNLLNWPDSVVVLDLKGENYDVTAGYRAKHGQAVYAFSPFDEGACSHRWNPLTAVRTSPLHRIGDLLAIGQVFFPNDSSTTSSEAFFNDQARNLFMGLGLLLLESPELPRTIGEMLRQSSGKGQPLKAHLEGAIALRGQAKKPLSVECADALQRLLSNSENTLTSIVATFNAPLTIFADAIVDAATSGDDFRLEDVRRRRMSIYVRVPPNRLASARPLLNLFFSQLVSLNTQQLPQRDPKLKWQCLIVNDEFAAMGRVGVISTATAFLAGYNLRLLTVVQAMSQLDAVYGDQEARTLRHQPRPADPVRAARAARRRRVQRHARPLHRARDLARAEPLVRRPRSHDASAAPRATSAAPSSCRRSSRSSAPERLVVDRRELQADPRREDPLPPRDRPSRRAFSRRRRCRGWTWICISHGSNGAFATSTTNSRTVSKSTSLAWRFRSTCFPCCTRHPARKKQAHLPTAFWK